MATTLPTLTRTIDDKFISTWYEIRAEAIDNILDAVVVWAALKGAGCMTTQVGGEYLTRTIRYGTQDATGVAKGDTLSQGEPTLKTMARWNWRYLSSHVQRSIFDDQKNAGEFQIVSLVNDRLTAAKEGMQAQYENDCLRATDNTEAAHKFIQSLLDIVPNYADARGASKTYGAIQRPLTYGAGDGVLVPVTGNTWWGPKYLNITTPKEVNLVSDMRTIYNAVHNNQLAPNLIISDLTLYNLYEEFGLDATQIVKDESTRLVDLGFEVIRFKGKPMIYTSNMYDSTNSKSRMLFLNTAFIEIVYDPNLWFDMTEFKPIPLQAERIAHILSACNIIGTQPRRHGMLTEEAVAAD